MHTIKLNVEDSKVHTVLNIIQSLKDNLIKKYEVVSDKNESAKFSNLSYETLEKTWDNKEDSVYDKFLKI